MKLDIVFVTFNSEKWIDGCLNSILKSDYNLKDLSLYFYDNNSSDNTVEILEKKLQSYGKKFNDFKIITGKKNKGFGFGNNAAAAYGTSKYILFLNIDTEIFPKTLKKLSNSISESDKSVKMWELMQRPYEHPKYYDPITGYTSWASGACMVVERDTFEKLKGFDTNIFMYCEDVEISWRFRSNGYNIKYLHNNPIMHYSYSEEREFKTNQFIYGFVYNWYLRAKYGTFSNYLKGLYYVFKEQFKGKNLPKDIEKRKIRYIKRKIRSLMLKNIIPYTLINIFGCKKTANFQPQFVGGIDYEINRSGAFYVKKDIKSKPLVSILVRTCNRPYALRENLISLRNQTYKNIEVVIVEDGQNKSEEMIKKEFGDLNINYYCTKVNVGRSAAGNIAMEKAKGKYYNFLDDDDVFYPDHVETLVAELENNNYDIVYSNSFETKINIISTDPYNYEVTAKGVFDFGNTSRLDLYKKNLYPIQAVMFKSKLFKECGGFDTNVDALEDWDFWIRLSLKHRFNYVEKTTSIFRTPYKVMDIKKRNEFLRSSHEYLQKKFRTYTIEFTVEDWNRF